MVERVLADAVKRHGEDLVPTDFEWYAFPQVWGSTALGLGGFGGQATTTAQTFIVLGHSEAYIYFGGRFAYKTDCRQAFEFVRALSAPSRTRLAVNDNRPEDS